MSDRDRDTAATAKSTRIGVAVLVDDKKEKTTKPELKVAGILYGDFFLSVHIETMLTTIYSVQHINRR